jgi:hypothetical protein
MDMRFQADEYRRDGGFGSRGKSALYESLKTNFYVEHFVLVNAFFIFSIKSATFITARRGACSV